MRLLLYSWHKRRRMIEHDAPETSEAFLEQTEGFQTATNSHRPDLSKFTLVVSMLVNVALLLSGLAYVHEADLDKDPSQQLYTPLKNVIEYRQQIFETPIPEEENDYVGFATHERNARWKALYPPSNTHLSRLEASRLHNKTAAAQPGSDDDYPIVLNVFHDLHCLDSIRMAFDYLRDPGWNVSHNPYTLPWPDGHQGTGRYSPRHAHHCFNGIRQSLQCSADVTPVVFKYYPGKDQIRSNFDVVHTCRNFEAIHKWALERVYTKKIIAEGWRSEVGHCGTDGCDN